MTKIPLCYAHIMSQLVFCQRNYYNKFLVILCVYNQEIKDMSKFSNYLKNLIESSGESIAFISRKSNIERTSIHKALTDERILPYASVQALAQHFKLPLDERQ